MRHAAILPLAFLCACSAQSPADDDAGVAEPTPAGPDVGIAATPGIALDYAYRLRLPANGIAAAQERHAAACERAGPARCRITGLHYRVDDRRAITATLDLALEPTIARAFGRAAVASVVAAHGSLVETTIATQDAGRTAGDAAEQRTTATARVAALERRLSDPATRGEERAVLAREVAELRGRVDTAVATAAAARATLAATPMHIAYEAGDLVPGFDRTAPLRDAGASAVDGFVAALAMLLTTVAALLPWGVALLLALWLWRRYGHRIARPDVPLSGPPHDNRPE
jgi:hypothetical protein